MRVFITGATGYVGRAVLTAVQQAGHQVVALQRPGSWRPIKSSEAEVEVVQGDITIPASLAGTMDGCDAVIHLVGIIRENRRQGATMDRIHHQGTRHVVAAAQAAGIKRFLHMSALGVRPHATTGYFQSKWAGEEAVRHTELHWTIFRPAVIFGDGGPGPEFIGLLADLVQKAPLVPVIGDGSFRLQPVSVETVGQGFARALHRPDTWQQTYEVGGGDVLTYLEILRRIAAALHKPLRKVHLPVGLMTALVPVMQNLPGFPLTADQLTMLLEENVCSDPASFYRDLGLQPQPFRIVLD